MDEKEYGILIDIAKNASREAFITSCNFETIWTNSKRTISDLLLSADKKSIHEKPQKEVSLSLNNGDVLKITPIKSGDSVRYYLFEVYDARSLLDLAAPLAAFKEYAKQYAELRESIIELAAKTSSAGLDPDELGLRHLMSSFSNKTAIFTMLSADSVQPCFDLTAAIDRLCSDFQKIISGRNDAEFDFETENGLYCRAYRPGLKYAVSNLLSNAWQYCDSDKKKIRLKAYRHENMIFIDISDNGSSADTDILEKSRQFFFSKNDSSESEGLGIAIADLFASRSSGKLSFIKDGKQGLTVRLAIPGCDPADDISFFSPSAADKNDSGITRDIFLKGSDITSIRYSEYEDKFIR